MVSYKNNVIGEKVFTAYYLYIHPIIALIIVVAEIALGNNSLNNEEYRDFYMYFVAAENYSGLDKVTTSSMYTC